MVTPRLADLLRRAATDEPDREAFVHGSERVTYDRLDRMVDGVAATLAGCGVTTGDVVAVLLPSSIAFAACYLGAARVGALTTAVNLRLGPEEQASILHRADPRAVVAGDPARLPECVRSAAVLSAEDLDAAFCAPPPEHLPRPDAGDPVCIVWTGGTTGVPKGAVYDHAALAAIARGQADVMSAHDRLLHAVPFPHLGFMGWCWGFLARRMTIVLGPEPWSAAATLRLVDAERVTVMNGVPTQWSRLLDHEDVSLTDFSTLRVVAMGGAAAPPELIRRLRETLGCPVLNGYSATEAGVISGTVIG
ncbi:MAG: long-chain fatty acid--CoA ligase, partial [Acidimicrobiia bacterium]